MRKESEKLYVYIYIYESLCCTPGTITALQINYTSEENFKVL